MAGGAQREHTYIKSPPISTRRQHLYKTPKNIARTVVLVATRLGMACLSPTGCAGLVPTVNPENTTLLQARPPAESVQTVGKSAALVCKSAFIRNAGSVVFKLMPQSAARLRVEVTTRKANKSTAMVARVVRLVFINRFHGSTNAKHARRGNILIGTLA